MQSTTAVVLTGLTEPEEWPSLGGSGAHKKTNPDGLVTAAEAAAAGETDESPENDWELLATPDHESSSWSQQPQPPQEKVVVVTHSNPKSLRHCASSPDLRCFELHDVAEEDSDWDQDNDCKSLNNKDNESFSYSMMSAPTSVWSISSGVSFRDAMLAKPAAVAPTGAPLSETKTTSGGALTAKPRHKQRIKPRFVVKPIKRCSKSTGDLQSLAIREEGEGAGDEEILGESDAMEFYHRKAVGYQGRINGSKLRPDEAKRLQITMYKKDLQRNANARR